MRTLLLFCLLLLQQYGNAPVANHAGDKGSASQTPTYTADGKLMFPANYREWVYLSTGMNMSYLQRGSMDHAMFDNVFVNPDSYHAFLKTGTWPDKTMFVLEVRAGGTNASINKAGNFQTPELMGREVHVKDESRFEGKWAFFGFDSDEPSKMVPKEASCYSCHSQHGAVDTTFVQFYPTLIDIAKSKGTLTAGYLKDVAEQGKEGKAGK